MNTPEHYAGLQPALVMRAWMSEEEYIGFLRGNVIKYIARYDKKGFPLADLEKCADYLAELIEIEIQRN